MKRIFIFALVAIASLSASAQNATNSPYSQYGHGALADQWNGASAAMAGTSLGWREGTQVNFANPASYSAIDSLSFIFDAGLSMNITNFQEGNVRKNANNSSFDYVIGAFRLHKHVGMAFGAMPYSNVGYTYFNENTIAGTDNNNTTNTTVTNTYTGNGGYRQIFLGLGVEPLKTKSTSISVGANASYIWGNTNRSVINSYSDSYVKTLSKFYVTSMSSMKFDFGAQIQQRITKDDVVTLGASFSPGHEFGGDSYCMVITNNSAENVADTTQYDSNGKNALPTTYGAGLTWNHGNRLKVGFDMTVQKWGELKTPMYTVVNNVASYTMTENQFSDRKRFSLGCDYTGNQRSRRYLDHLHLRAGAYYTTSYLKINGNEGPKEYGLSCGVGIPIVNTFNNRSVVNVSAQWTHMDAANLIKENTFRITVGLTFCETWFAKWKLD